MTNDTELQLMYGRRTHPPGVRACWGARLIWPNDLVWNRQDLVATDDESKHELVTWLNGPNNGDGALSKALTALREPYSLGLSHNTDDEAVIYEDSTGKIIGSAQSSHGYLYVAGWIKAHAE
jgi:hypothetical protein